jgi:hypothetical protein
VVAAILLPGSSACGKKGPPQAPIRILPVPARESKVQQIGGEVVLAALLPMQRTDGTPLGPRAQVKVLRMRGSVTIRPGAVSSRYLQRQFEKEARTIAVLSGGVLAEKAPGGRLRLVDPEAVASAGRPGRARFLYAVLVVDSEGRRSSLSAPVEIEVVPPPPAPSGLTAATAEGEVRLSWTPGTPPSAGQVAPAPAESSGATPGRAVPAPPAALFNVYRRMAAEAQPPEAPLNPQPLQEPAYVDRSFRHGETYFYSARMLVDATRPLRESAGSPEVEVHPVDTYPPRAPTGLAAAAEGGVIKLYWFPGSESDLAGYRIYRRAAPEGEFARIGQVGAAETSFVDATARPGVRYDYVVTAIDDATPPNESERSESRSDTLPADAPAPPAGPAPGAAATPTPGRDA